jgi:hypothetical protein
VWAIKQHVTSQIAMGHMLPDYFLNAKSQDVESKHDTEGGA